MFASPRFPRDLISAALLAILAIFPVKLLSEEAPRAPFELEDAGPGEVRGPGTNLIRNGSFEGSTKYATQAGEWKPRAGKISVDPTTAAIGKSSVVQNTVNGGAGMEFAPYLCKPNKLYCVSFYAKGEGLGNGVDWKIYSYTRGMQIADNEKQATYPRLQSDTQLARDWKRYSYFMPANRVKPGKGVVDSYYMTIGAKGVTRYWVDGLMVEEVPGFDEAQVAAMTPATTPASVPGFPTEFKLYAPVEICAEAINLPSLNLYTSKDNVARVQAAVANGSKPLNLTLVWKLLDDHGQLIAEAGRKTRNLAASETCTESRDVTLDRKGAMVVRIEALDEKGSLLNYSDEPVTVLPFDNTSDSDSYDERFGVNLGWGTDLVAPPDNLALQLMRRLGFRWVRNTKAGWNNVEESKGRFDWSKADFAVNFARENGFHQFITIGGIPKWNGTGAMPNFLPNDMNWASTDPRWDDLSLTTSLDNYIKQLVTRYKGKVDAYQIGNETSNSHPGTRKVDPQLACKLCHRIALDIRAIDPGVQIIGASLIWTKLDWWADVIKLGGLNDMDYLGWDFDCYVVSGTPKAPLAAINAAMLKLGGKVLPMFNYETGWGSGWMQDYPADPIGGPRIDYGKIPDSMMKTFATAFGNGTSHFILHHAAYQENFMGAFTACTRWPVQLYDEQERPRVTLAPYAVGIHFLGLSRFVSEISRPDLGMEGYLFINQRDNMPVAVYWSSREIPADIDLPVSLDWQKYEFYDVMGNVLPLEKAVLKSKNQVLILSGKPGSSAEEIEKAFGANPGQ